MLMNVLASALLFLIIGPFKHVSSGETKETGVSTSQVKKVYIAVNDTLELNCSINATIHNIHPTQLGWKHNTLTLVNFTCIVNNNTIQLRKNRTQYDDAGIYECGLFDSSKFQFVQKVEVLVGEKPKSISNQKFKVAVYGKPVIEVTVKWPTLQANFTNELFFGRVPAGPEHFVCEFNSTAQCRRTPTFQNEMLECQIGMDVLTKLFQRNELFGRCSIGYRCTRLCAKVVVTNSFGASESEAAAWNLLHETRCPPLRNLTVSFSGEDNLTVSWQRPPVSVRVQYYVTCVITPILTGKALPPKYLNDHDDDCFECAWNIHGIIPYARYTFTATCMIEFEYGPPVHTEVKTKEAAPSEAPPSCEVKNRSTTGTFVSWKLPPISTWNGKPNKFWVYYGDQRIAVNTSLAELQTHRNRSTSPGVKLKNLDPAKDYTVRVAMCTGGGCGNLSTPCFIGNATDEDSTIIVVASPDDTNRTDVITVLVSAIGAIGGLILVVFVVFMIGRKRSQRKERPSLTSALGPLSGIHPYDTPIDEGPSLCEDDQCYDSIDAIIHRPLLANVDGAVANIPVTEI